MEVSYSDISPIINKVEENSSILQKVIDDTVSQYSTDMDSIMRGIYVDIIEPDKSDQVPDISIIERYFLELSNCIYFMQDKLEKLSMMDDISKSVYKEAYNNYYLEAQLKGTSSTKKPTVAELTATAEISATNENVVNNIYSHAYSILKQKISSANIMVNSLSKIISKRMNEMNLSAVQPAVINTKKILNEDVNIF